MHSWIPANTQAIVFDVDGTLIDSNDAHASAWVEALEENGVSVAFDTIRPLIGIGGDKILPRIAHVAENSSAGRRILDRRGEIFREKFLPSLRPFPQVRELLLKLREDGLKLAIATSASEEDLTLLLKQAGVADLFSRRASADDAEHSKPNPDIVLAALEKLKVEAAHALMIGDTPYDLEAALRAGVPSLAFRCGGYWNDAELAEAVAICDGPAALLTQCRGNWAPRDAMNAP